MAREYFCAYHSLMQSLTPFGDAECGRLFRAALKYSATGEAEEFRGNEKFIWPTIKQMIDRDREAYDAKCKTNRENGARANGTERWRTVPNAPQEKEKEEEKDKEDFSPPIPPSPGGGDRAPAFDPEEQVRESVVDPVTREALLTWLSYKRERREGYKEQGLKALITTAIRYAAQYGTDAVADIIRESIANRYQGIVWDRLKRQEIAAKPSGNVFFDMAREEGLM